MTEFEIREVTFEDLAPLHVQAKRDKNIAFKPTKNTQWFGLYLGSDLVAFGGVISVRNDFEVARIKSGFTDPVWRGCGYGKALVDHRIAWCQAKGTKIVETISARTQFWMDQGFELTNRKNFYRRTL